MWMNKHVSVPSISIITWNMRPILFSIALVQFGLSGPLTRCLYYWDLLVSGKFTAFTCTGWIVISHVVLFVCSQSYPVLCTVYEGNNVGVCMGSGIFTMWLAMRLCTFSCLDLVLYVCTCGRCTWFHHMVAAVVVYSVSSCMTWGLVWGGCIFARPGVIVIFYFIFTLWRGASSRGTDVAGCCVLSLRCGGSGVRSTLGSCAVGGEGFCVMAMLNMAASWFSAAVYFSPSCGMGLGEAGLWRASARSDATCVTESTA